MGKKILFVMHSANIGGPVTSLLNMIELLKSNGINVDVFLMAHLGELLYRFENNSNLLGENKIIAAATCRKEDFQKRYGFRGLIARFCVVLSNRLHISILKDFVYRREARKLKGYDVVISYQETTVTDFVRFIESGKRIAWVHSIFDKFSSGYYTVDQMKKVYDLYNDIVCVAQGSADAFKKGLPSLAGRVCIINNPISIDRVITMAMQETNSIIPYERDASAFVFVSVGRLSYEKQYEFVVEAARLLRDKDIRFLWYIIGDGSEREKLESLIKKYELCNQVILTGFMTNPYPIIRCADALVITSLYEAQPMVALEALILDTPVITTNYQTAFTLIEDGRNGLICENSIDAVFKTVLDFVENDSLREILIKGAKDYRYTNEEIFRGFQHLID